jgi:hypothetical protein
MTFQICLIRVYLWLGWQECIQFNSADFYSSLQAEVESML